MPVRPALSITSPGTAGHCIVELPKIPFPERMKFSSQKLSRQLRRESRLVIKRLAEQGYHCPQLSRKSLIECELSLIEAYESNLVAAIGRGENMGPLLAGLRGKEKRKKQLIEALGSVDIHFIQSIEATR